MPKLFIKAWNSYGFHPGTTVNATDAQALDGTTNGWACLSDTHTALTLSPGEQEVISAGTILITGNLTITANNQAQYSGKTWEFMGPWTVTLSKGLPNFGAVIIPPASGNATVAGDGTTILLNGALTPVNMAFATKVAFVLFPRASAPDSYLVS